MSGWDGYDDGGYGDEKPPSAPQYEAGQAAGEIPGYPGWTAGDFVDGKGLLGIRRPSGQSPRLQLAAMRTPAPGDGLGPTQAATRAVNGVPLAIFQPQPSDTGASSAGDVDGLIRSLSKLSPSVLERFSNANIPFISVPDSADQAFPNSNLLQNHPRGYPAGQDFGDAAGGFFDFRAPKTREELGLSPTDPFRALVVGSPGLTSSFDVRLHEPAHAWDTMNGSNGVSESQLSSFQRAYAAENENLTAQAEAKTRQDPANRDAYYYYLQQPSSLGGYDPGAAEAYAESFARYVGGDPTLKTDWPHLSDFWEAQDRARGLRSTPAQHGR
jgi:hypothetical protein